MEEILTKIVSQIFGNWTALQLAVEHSMAGPQSKQIALDCMNYVIQYCQANPNAEEEDLQDLIEDLIDEEFNLVCEDDSPKQIGHLLCKFLKLLSENKIEQCEEEFSKLPVGKTNWLISSPPVPQTMADSSSDEEESPPKPEKMDEDGWVEVTRKKR